MEKARQSQGLPSETLTMADGWALHVVDWEIGREQRHVYEWAEPMVEFHYCLSGETDAQVNASEIQIKQDQMLLSYYPYVQMETMYKPDQRLNCISLSCAPACYDQRIAALFPDRRMDYQSMMGDKHYYGIARTLDPHLIGLLRQMLQCPYHDAMRSLYMESKMLEVLAASVEATLLSEGKCCPEERLREEDKIKLRHAREVLLSRMDSPPSLLQLARIVGLNDNKLKAGFKLMYGRSVFHYLRDCRMDRAMDLLRGGEMNVSEAAWKVGYTNLSHFAEMFRTRFGMNPGQLLRQRADQ